MSGSPSQSQNAVSPESSSTVPGGEEKGELVVLKVEDMACPACAATIERGLSRTPGVLRAEALFVTDRVRVTFEPHRIAPEEIVKAVGGLGYHATDTSREREVHSLITSDTFRLGLSIFLTANVMMLALALDLGFFQEFPPEVIPLLGVPMLLLSTVVVFYGGFPIQRKAIVAARIGRFQMETLIASGALLAWGLSLVNLLAGSLHLYFDTASMLVTLILLGTFIEGTARKSATKAIDEMSALMPVKGRVLRDGEPAYLPLGEIREGDALLVEAGEQVPADGTVIDGSGLVDDSMLTGEPERSPKAPGDPILSATVLEEGALRVKVERVGEGTAAGQMIALMEEALASKSPFERLADRIAPVFVLIVMAIAVGTAVSLGLSRGAWESGVVRAVTVLVVACPCTLGIAIPLAKVAAVGAARRMRILVRNADALESAPGLGCVILDKTGTATHGEYRVQSVTTEGAGEEAVLSRAASLEGSSKHLIARAIIREARGRGMAIEQAAEVEEIEGFGVRGRVEGGSGFVGNRALVDRAGARCPEAFESRAKALSEQGLTAVFAGWGGEVRAVLALGDRVRPDMKELVTFLKGKKVRTELVSGDDPATTASLAEVLDVDGFLGRALPADKVELVKARQGEGLCVAMVGDGINDAPALAASDVGFAMGTAMDVARKASDVTLLGEGGTQIRRFLSLSAFTMRTVRTNLVLALLYNGVAVPLAVSGLITPLIAVTAMVVSSLTVVFNSSRILRKPL
ncbi:MAG: heavy metal translocating P-type ATPase [Planctomycetota bacterium]|jgi:heavy metal translocating P-type ATPase